MAAQQSIALVIHPAQVVGNAFVTQYYNVLHQSPEMAYRFYQESSKLGRPGPNGEIITVTSMEGINQMIMSLGYGECKSVIKTIDSQESYNSGVLVLVTGSLTFNNSGTRLFTQSFFLAPQDKGYFVLNDIFKYLDEEAEHTENGIGLLNGVVEQANNIPATEPVAEPEPLVENGVIERSTTPEKDDPAVEEAFNSTEQAQVPEGSTVGTESVIEQHTSPVNNEVQSPCEAPLVVHHVPKKSYASIVKVMSENTAPVIAVQKLSKARSVPLNTERQANSSIPQKSSSVESPPSSTTASGTDNSNTLESEGNGCSIYIRNLPYNATASQLEEEFKTFGAIKPSGVQVRSKQGGFCYGFVEFETAASVQTAIEASPIIIGGRQAYVEEKRPASGTRAPFSRGRPALGRGVFRNDGVRGRGAYGGRGNGRTEFSNKDDFGNKGRGSSGRGGGYPEDSDGYQRVGHFRNGGRGARQGGMMTTNGPRMGSVAA